MPTARRPRRPRRLWTLRCAEAYGWLVGRNARGRRVAPVRRPEALDRYDGMWVAVLDGEVVIAEHTSHHLALKLHDMDHRKRRRAVVEYVRPSSDAYIVGAG